MLASINGFLNGIAYMDYNTLLNCKSPEEIKERLEGLDFAIVVNSISKNTVILRCRTGVGYRTKAELTYCPAHLCKHFNRASMPGNTMFYGVISDNQDAQENARFLCAAECSSLARIGKESIGREYMTLSFWRVISPLNVISFVTEDTFSNVNNNSLLTQLRNSYLKRKSKMNDSQISLN